MKEFEKTLGPRLDLAQVIQSQSPSMALAAEFKRASPSKGDIAIKLTAGGQASNYAIAGASVISILTEPYWFKGALRDLTDARKSTTQTQNNGRSCSRPAILRKDFVFNSYQILEAAAAGADTVLLIVAILPSYLLKELIEFSRSMDMEPLVEVHGDLELDVVSEFCVMASRPLSLHVDWLCPFTFCFFLFGTGTEGRRQGNRCQ